MKWVLAKMTTFGKDMVRVQIQAVFSKPYCVPTWRTYFSLRNSSNLYLKWKAWHLDQASLCVSVVHVFQYLWVKYFIPFCIVLVNLSLRKGGWPEKRWYPQIPNTPGEEMPLCQFLRSCGEWVSQGFYRDRFCTCLLPSPSLRSQVAQIG